MVAAPNTFRSKAEAASYLSEVETDLVRGRYVDPRAGDLRFEEWAAEWLDRAGKRRASKARDEVALRVWFNPRLGRIPLSQIRPEHVRAAVDAMAAEVAPSTAQRSLSTLRAVLNAAIDSDLISRSPARGIRIDRGRPTERPMLTIPELVKLAESVHPRHRALILVGGVLGLRWSECVGLRIGSIDLAKATLTVDQTISEVGGRLEVDTTKSHASRRTMSIPKFLVQEIADHLAQHRPGAGPTDLVFVGRQGAPLRRSFAARHFAPAVERAGLNPALTFHGLRHVATSLMVEAGEHPRVIQARLGHATARLSMELYAHVPDAADRRAADHLDDQFEAMQPAT